MQIFKERNDMMSGIIRISMSGGKGNPPTIRNFRQEGVK